jgi:hypothetical protein
MDDNGHTPEIFKYYSTQRPVDIGTFPKTGGGPRDIVNFDRREAVEQGRFMAWGYLEYSAPLTEKQMDDYDLRAAPDNPDVKKRMAEQAQAVGKWEKQHRVPDGKRLTWWYPDFGVFVPKEYVTAEQMNERHNYVAGSTARAAEKRAAKRPIAEQLAVAEKQVERGAGTKKQHKSHDER